MEMLLAQVHSHTLNYLNVILMLFKVCFNTFIWAICCSIVEGITLYYFYMYTVSLCCKRMCPSTIVFQSIHLESHSLYIDRFGRRLVVYVLRLYSFIFTVPVPPSSCNITLLYNQLSRRLQFIDTTWDLMPVAMSHNRFCSLFISKQRVYTLHC